MDKETSDVASAHRTQPAHIGRAQRPMYHNSSGDGRLHRGAGRCMVQGKDLCFASTMANFAGSNACVARFDACFASQKALKRLYFRRRSVSLPVFEVARYVRGTCASSAQLANCGKQLCRRSRRDSLFTTRQSVAFGLPQIPQRKKASENGHEGGGIPHVTCST